MTHRFLKTMRIDMMFFRRKTDASFCIGLLYIALVASYFLSFVVVLMVGGIPAVILWVPLATWIWPGLERIVQFIEGKLH